MALLHGVVAPPGDGLVIEVHLDIMEAPHTFLERLTTLGFEDDPFLDFYPPEYRFHFTGRTRALQKDIVRELPSINSLITQVIEEASAANVGMYAECELVRKIDHFPESSLDRDLSALDRIAFKESSRGCAAQADIHVEFRSGMVPEAVRELMLDRGFYWVRTPASSRFPSEEIATVQTSALSSAHDVYDRLVAVPLPACTGIHLEQKLAMLQSSPQVSMPPVMDVFIGEY